MAELPLSYRDFMVQSAFRKKWLERNGSPEPIRCYSGPSFSTELAEVQAKRVEGDVRESGRLER